MSSGFMPYEWEGNSANSVFLVLVYQRKMGRRKFFAFSVVKKIQPTGRIPSRFYAKDVIDFVLGLSNMPYSRNLRMFLFYEFNSPHEVCISSGVCFIPFLVSSSTFYKILFPGIKMNITCQSQIITTEPNYVKEISQLNIFLKTKYNIFCNLEEDFLF